MLHILLLAAMASQVFYEPVSLEEVLRQSPVIALVEPVEGGGRAVQVPMTGPSGPVLAFETRLARLRVIEVLRAPAGLVSPAQVVEVGAANLEQQIELHRSYYVDGVSESPIYPLYESGLPPAATQGRHILFLRPCAIGGEALLCGVVDGAVAAATDRERVLGLARAHPWLGGPTVELPGARP